MPTHYLLKFRTPVSVFTGLGIAGLVDRAVMRNGQQLPCIPGSTVKGRWRFFSERLLRSLNLPDDLSIHKEGRLCKQINEPDKNCTLCRLFGSPAVPGMVQIGPAELEEPVAQVIKTLLKSTRNSVVHPDSDLRPGIALTRQRRTALGDHLFFDEVLPALSFKGPIHFAGELGLQELAFLKASARLVDALGARKDVGRGALANGITLQ